MKMLRFAAALLLAATGMAHAQNAFTIQNKGVAVGKCVYTFDKSKDGFKVVSRYQARITAQFKAGDVTTMGVSSNTTDVQQSHSYKLDGNYGYLGGNVIDSTNQLNNGYSPNKQHTVMQLSMIQGGVQGPSSEFPLQPGFIVLPNYDASAIQALLYQATAHPTPDNLYFLIVPQPGKSPLNVQSKWVPQPDATGTLAGKPVTLHHFGFAFGKNIYDVYADEANTLMQTNISVLNLSYIRNGFVLDAAAK